MAVLVAPPAAATVIVPAWTELTPEANSIIVKLTNKVVVTVAAPRVAVIVVELVMAMLAASRKSVPVNVLVVLLPFQISIALAVFDMAGLIV